MCPKCDVLKPLGLFPANKKTPDGLSPWCRTCHNAATRNTIKARKAEYRDYHKQYDKRRNLTLREAERVLKEEALAEWRRLVAKQVGGTLGDAYAALRRTILCLDGSLRDHQERDVKVALRDALIHAYKVEDCLGVALREASRNRNTVKDRKPTNRVGS